MKRDLFPKTIAGFYLQMSKRFWAYVASLILLYITYDVLVGILPQLTVKWLVDGIQNAAPDVPLLTQMVPMLTIVAFMYLALLVSDILSSWIRGHYSPIVRVKIAEVVHRRMAKQSVAFFKDNSAGFLVEQSNFVINKYNKIAIDHINEIIALVMTVSVNSALLFKIHWAVASLFAVCAGLRLIHCAFHARKLWTSGKRAAKLGSMVTSNYVDSISNFMNIKLFSRRDSENRYLNKVRGHWVKARQIATYYERKFWILPYSFEQICAVGMVFLLIRLYGSGHINLGDIAFTFMSFAMMMNLIRKITWKIPEIADDVTTVTQAYNDIAKPVSVCDCDGAKLLRTDKCQIDFSNVSFKYKDNDWIFKNLNLCIKPGEKVGLVGLSGSGKSTLLYLIMRLYDINKGSIKIDGKDVRDVTQDSLRACVSFVPQDCVLFNRTLAENISYGKSDARMSDIISAAKQASAHEFIMNTEQGYNTPVGDRGITLSGGQRQRVAIARTICKDAPIVVMDEATSALDSKTEQLVQNSMKKILRGRTALVVAHRLSTLRQMDRIIVLDHGKIAEQGSHNELIKNKDGIYAKLWSMQVDGFIK